MSCHDCSTSSINISYTSYSTSLEYYFNTSDSLNKAYNKLLEFLVTNGKHIEETIHQDTTINHYKKVMFKNPYYVDRNTLKQLNRRFPLVEWPNMIIKKYEKDGIYSLVMVFERNILNKKQ